jgi:hypothetical protein
MKTNRTTQKRGAAKQRAKKTNSKSLVEFEGNEYTGQRIDENWALGKGKWTENRRGPKEWDIVFETIALKAFKGHKAMPVGSEYQSFILAQQNLVKTRNNTYKVKLEGIKFKLAHKEAGESWSANALARKNTLVKILKAALAELEMGHGQAPSETKKPPLKGVNK